ncbi:hypothetical protein AM1_1007 [Acaryochloris marina MBIC11017]|uniref:Uncharacterized protein n=1 Tax=Acaryochloris marina (strain MBIC 11017) TaxID=329726 RepID=B0C0S5_ACAM1|nr:hypothetical protein AM1_1007 [Acaryochloris marina MBIC11017]
MGIRLNSAQTTPIKVGIGQGVDGNPLDPENPYFIFGYFYSGSWSWA